MYILNTFYLYMYNINHDLFDQTDAYIHTHAYVLFVSVTDPFKYPLLICVPFRQGLCLAIVQSNCSVGGAFGLAALSYAFITNYLREFVVNAFGEGHGMAFWEIG